MKSKVYYNTFANGLDAFDDATYTTQSANGRFRSPYDDHAYGASVESGADLTPANTLKGALFYRTDVHREQQTSRPTHPTLSSIEPVQEQEQNTWSFALEDTVHVTSAVDVVGGISYDRYEVTKAEDFNTTLGVFEYPKGSADAFNWQSAVIWRYAGNAQVHASVSDRARFPILFELYSTRFGTATPNPDLGPERATNVELGWKGRPMTGLRLEGTVFYSDVRDLIQTVVLAGNTTQTQNVGDGRFYGVEFAVDAPISPAADGWRQLHRDQAHDPRRAAAGPAADGRADAQGIPVCRVAADRGADDHAEPRCRGRSVERHQHQPCHDAPVSADGRLHAVRSVGAVFRPAAVRRRVRAEEPDRR